MNFSQMDFRCGLPPIIPTSFVPNSINLAQGVIAIVCALIGLPLNIYLFIIIVKFKSLHQQSLKLMLQLVIIGILYHLVISPVILASAVSGGWPFGEVACNLLGIIHDIFSSLRFFFTLVFTTDRFIFIFWPFFYIKYKGVISLLDYGP